MIPEYASLHPRATDSDTRLARDRIRHLLRDPGRDQFTHDTGKIRSERQEWKASDVRGLMHDGHELVFKTLTAF
jgi:hypothetical protein